MINRRRFIQAACIFGPSLGLTACDDTPPFERYNQADVNLLAKQRIDEANAAGKSRFGKRAYSGYKGLAELPWFELNQSGRLVCVDQSLPEIIDMHAHLGMSVLFRPRLNLQAKTDRVHHLLDCDNEKSACELDLDVYVNGNFTESNLDKLESTILSQALWGNRVIRSHTIPNLIAEMDDMRVDKSVLLPIKLGLPFGDSLTEQWRSSVSSADMNERLLTGFSVHPDQDDCIDQMREYAKSGLKLMKLHPTVQKFYPDDPAVLKIYEEAQSLGISIFFHGGRAGIEPESSHRYAMPRHYKKALNDFPRLQFILGHAGARDVDAMLELMLAHDNAWLGTHGQGISKLDRIIDRTLSSGSASQRIMFGSDWPFYHLGASLAKVLIVTDSPSRKPIRDALLKSNAVNFLNEISA